jgi:hypothetical protein
MPCTPESQARTRVFARVIGPLLVILFAAVMARATEMGLFISSFFANAALVWITGCAVLVCGLLIVAQHQYWWNPPAVVISILGWILIVRGAVLLIVPQFIARFAAQMATAVLTIQIGSSIMLLVGLWLAWIGWCVRPSDARDAG